MKNRWSFSVAQNKQNKNDGAKMNHAMIINMHGNRQMRNHNTEQLAHWNRINPVHARFLPKNY